MQIQCGQLGGAGESLASSIQKSSTSDITFHIQDKVLFVDSVSAHSDKERTNERVFVSGIRKNVEIADDIHRIFSRHGL